MSLPFNFAIAAGSRRWQFLLLSVLLLVGCSPAHEWRELPAADGAVQVTFPGKPSTDSRDLPMAGRLVTFKISAVEAAGATFAVGHMTLKPEELQQSGLPELTDDEITDALVQSLVRGFDSQDVITSEVAVRRLRAPTDTGATAVEVLAEQPEGLRLLARVFHHQDQWIQVVAVGPSSRLDTETARWFVDSLRLQ